jgi:hypothetical protein
MLRKGKTMSNHSDTTQTDTRRKLFRVQISDPGKSIPKLEQIINKEDKYKNDDYIQNRFIILVLHYNHMSRQNSNTYAFFRVVLIFVSALTSLIVALEAIVLASTLLKIVALVLTLIVGILGNYLTMFNVQAKWGAYRSIRESLIAEFYKFYMGIAPYSPSAASSDERKLFAANVEQLIENANKSWGGLHLASDAGR